MNALAYPAGEGEGQSTQAAARRAGLEFVEKLLTTKLESADMTERNAGMLRVPLVASVELATGRTSASSWSWSPSPTEGSTRAPRPYLGSMPDNYFPAQGQAGPRQVTSPFSTLTVSVERSTTTTKCALMRSPVGLVKMSVSASLKMCPLSTKDSVP